MTNQQYKVLRFCYKRPRTLTEIREKVLKIKEQDFLMIYQSILDKEMGCCTTFDRDDNNWMNSKMGLDAKGVEFVEQKKQENFDRISSNAREWITTLIAVAAFILSIISLTKQSVP